MNRVLHSVDFAQELVSKSSSVYNCYRAYLGLKLFDKHVGVPPLSLPLSFFDNSISCFRFKFMQTCLAIILYR